MQVALRPANKDDCVLLVANCVLAPETNESTSEWTILRGGEQVSAKYFTHSAQQGANAHVCLVHVDQPTGRGALEYDVGSNAGPALSRFVASPDRQRRSLLAVDFPAYQVAWAEEQEKQVLRTGAWEDVDGLASVVTTSPGERVLVVCTAQYSALWSSELSRGRFTIVRDDIGLDGAADRGLQSVRALAPGSRRTMLMVTVDDPPPGPHLYRARATVTADADAGDVNVLEGMRQLALIRLPKELVAGPMHSHGPVVIDRTTWVEIDGLCTAITLRKPRDKVMLVYHVDCHPQDYVYEARFTVLRRGGAHGDARTSQSLGFSEDFGVEAVSSNLPASSEYPVGIVCDTPGAAGTWTYSLAARVADMNKGEGGRGAPVCVGFSGSISAVLLSSSSSAAVAT